MKIKTILRTIQLPDGSPLNFRYAETHHHIVFWKSYYGHKWNYSLCTSIESANAVAAAVKMRYEVAPEVHVQELNAEKEE